MFDVSVTAAARSLSRSRAQSFFVVFDTRTVQDGDDNINNNCTADAVAATASAV